VLESLLAALVALRAAASSSSKAGESRGRRSGATVGKASTTTTAASRTAHWSPEKIDELLVQEATQMASMNVARKRRTSIKGNRQTASHLKRPSVPSSEVTKCDTNISPRRLIIHLLYHMVHYRTNRRGSGH
jgi:hypothetical protein